MWFALLYYGFQATNTCAVYKYLYIAIISTFAKSHFVPNTLFQVMKVYFWDAVAAKSFELFILANCHLSIIVVCHCHPKNKFSSLKHL